MSSKKKILIIMPLTSIGYVNFGKYLVNKQLRLSTGKTAMNFITPDGSKHNIASTFFHNLKQPYTMNYEFKELYNKDKHPQLEILRLQYTKDNDGPRNNPIINVSKTKETPIDYNGYIGAPYTFLAKVNYDDIDIVGILRPKLNGKEIFVRVIIKWKSKQ